MHHAMCYFTSDWSELRVSVSVWRNVLGTKRVTSKSKFEEKKTLNKGEIDWYFYIVRPLFIKSVILLNQP